MMLAQLQRLQRHAFASNMVARHRKDVVIIKALQERVRVLEMKEQQHHTRTHKPHTSHKSRNTSTHTHKKKASIRKNTAVIPVNVCQYRTYGSSSPARTLKRKKTIPTRPRSAQLMTAQRCVYVCDVCV